MNRKKPKFWDKVRYQFDNLMSKGTIALVGMLFLITAIVVVISGVLGAAANKDDLLDADGSELYMKKASRYVKTGV